MMKLVTISEPAESDRTPLLEVRNRQCRFIVSESLHDAICCGAPTSETSSWCSWHRQLVYTPRHMIKADRRAA